MDERAESWRVWEDGGGWDFKPKTVGRPPEPNPERAVQWNAQMLRMSPNLGRWHPRGVFRFKTWEEFNAWKDREHQANP